MTDLHYSDAIAASRTMIALKANADALQSRLPKNWELAPYIGDDLRGSSLKGANLLVPFHEVYAVRPKDGQPTGMMQLSYVAFVSQARNVVTGELAHIHWHSYTEDPEGIPGKYKDATLANIIRSQTFTKEKRGETAIQERFSAVAKSGEIHMALSYIQGAQVMWVTAEEPNLLLLAAKDTNVMRWYQEDQVLDIARSDPLKINAVSSIDIKVRGELEDVFDGTEQVIAVVVQRPYVRRVSTP